MPNGTSNSLVYGIKTAKTGVTPLRTPCRMTPLNTHSQKMAKAFNLLSSLSSLQFPMSTLRIALVPSLSHHPMKVNPVLKTSPASLPASISVCERRHLGGGHRQIEARAYHSPARLFQDSGCCKAWSALGSAKLRVGLLEGSRVTDLQLSKDGC